MFQPIITGTGVFTPESIITNDELVTSFNAYVDRFNAAHEEEIVKGEVAAKTHSNADFIREASGIEQRYVIDKEGILDPTRMAPRLDARADEAPSLMAEMGIDAINKALAAAARDPSEVDLILCAASNHERAYPAIASFNTQVLVAPSASKSPTMVICWSSIRAAIKRSSATLKPGTD